MFVVAALTVLSRLRHLIFESMTANVDGVAAIMARMPQMEGAAERLKSDFATALHYWPVLLFASGWAPSCGSASSDGGRCRG